MAPLTPMEAHFLVMGAEFGLLLGGCARLTWVLGGFLAEYVDEKLGRKVPHVR